MTDDTDIARQARNNAKKSAINHAGMLRQLFGEAIMDDLIAGNLCGWIEVASAQYGPRRAYEYILNAADRQMFPVQETEFKLRGKPLKRGGV